LKPDRDRLLELPIRQESDLVALRQQTRRAAGLLGFDSHSQTRIATAASEIARNAYVHGGGGVAEVLVEGVGEGGQMLVVRIADRGEGMADPEAILDGRPATGSGRGLVATRRLVDRFFLDSAPGRGTTVELGKLLPRRASAEKLNPSKIAAMMSHEGDGDVLAALTEQNRELIRSLEELGARQEELDRLNSELSDTNRGVIALYSELDDKAEQLKRASELKSRFLSYMSHEFRTPLNSILALTRLLLDRMDGELTAEQERQVRYIRASTEGMTELVNDLLDLAKVEAGKLDVKPVAFTVAELFGGLRGVLRPLLTSDAVDLVFDDVPADMPVLVTDEGKVAQILRNFISNALKFTSTGEVRVSAAFDDGSGRILFGVRDTGIGIAPSEHERLFQDFSQIDNPLQRTVKGTGLGLPLSRRLANLLGGDVFVESDLGAGSLFSLSIPYIFGASASAPQRAATAEPTGERRRVLVVDDEDAFRYVFRQMIGSEPGIEVIEAANGLEALRSARQERPDVIVLDLQMPQLDGYETLRELAADSSTSATPVIVSTSSVIDDDMRRRLAKASAIVSKASLSRDSLRALVQRVMHEGQRAS